MTNLITRARKEWCDERIGRTIPHGSPCPIPPERCPPEVVAALLDVLRTAQQGLDPYSIRVRHGQAAEAAIARALEGK